ncbi:MAG: helix-turn-helix domain-containing protein [Tannerellaceae bacterium]|nr:helix-turn-helix domain-containing protein [Tannerellaceae bacterium]
MDKFQIIQPSALLTPYVKQYWFVRMENVAAGAQRLVPFGCMALTFQRGDTVYSSFKEKSYLSGNLQSYTDLFFAGTIDFICIVFQPHGVRAFFDVPPNELPDHPVSLSDMSDPVSETLERQLQDSSDTDICKQLIERFLLCRLSRLHTAQDKRIAYAVRSIHQGETDVRRLAELSCLGYKQFKRIFTEQTGMNPKTYQQIVRFQKLHHLLQQHTGMTLNPLADQCGYYDKSHLIKEVKTFSGFSPTGLQQACDPVYSGYHALFRLAFIDLPPGKQVEYNQK